MNCVRQTDAGHLFRISIFFERPRDEKHYKTLLDLLFLESLQKRNTCLIHITKIPYKPNAKRGQWGRARNGNNRQLQHESIENKYAQKPL